jgi:uncharacterized caspase-like protein
MKLLRRILLVLLFIIPTICIKAQKVYVISVGIADYKYINDLRYTEADVNSFNRIMSQHKAEIVTLIGTEASHANIIKTIRLVFAKATPSDAVIFFFSGHGYEGGFCCYDMRPNSHLGGMSYQEMQILFRNCRAGKKVVFADACFSGGLSKQRTQLQVQAVSNNDVMFFLSSKLDETSLELPNGPNGLYTYFLTKGLCGEADTNNNYVITATEIYNYVNVNVSAWANQIPHNQHPMVWGKYDKNMPILDWR